MSGTVHDTLRTVHAARYLALKESVKCNATIHDHAKRSGGMQQPLLTGSVVLFRTQETLF